MKTIITDEKVIIEKWDDEVIYRYNNTEKELKSKSRFNRKLGMYFIDSKGKIHCYDGLETMEYPSKLV